VTGPVGRWKLDGRPRAQRQLARLPEKIAAAAAKFITGPCWTTRAVSAICCVMNMPGSIPPAVARLTSLGVMRPSVDR